MFKKPTPKQALDSLIDKVWPLCVGHYSTEVFATGVTLLVNAGAEMSQTTRSEAAHRLRIIADKIQTGEAYEP